MHFAAGALALLRQCLHLHQVRSIRSEVIEGHREAFRSAHIIAVGIPLWWGEEQAVKLRTKTPPRKVVSCVIQPGRHSQEQETAVQEYRLTRGQIGNIHPQESLNPKKPILTGSENPKQSPL